MYPLRGQMSGLISSEYQGEVIGWHLNNII